MVDSSDGLLHRIRDDVDDLKEAAVEHRVRLENGSAVFRGFDSRIKTVEERTVPKPPSAIKIIGITLMVVMTGAGALWALANMLRDRPTVEQIDKIIDSHEQGGHKELRDDVNSIQTEQGAQRTLIEAVKTEQVVQHEKLDTLLERTPAPPPKRPQKRRRSP